MSKFFSTPHELDKKKTLKHSEFKDEVCAFKTSLSSKHYKRDRKEQKA